MLPKITFIYAGVMALMFFALSVYVVAFRWNEKRGLGFDHSNPKSPLFKAVRIHGNFAEFIPFLILLMAFDEMAGQSGTTLHTIGAALIIGRVAHFLGLNLSHGPSVPRAIGVFLTFSTLVYLAVDLIKRGVA